VSIITTSSDEKKQRQRTHKRELFGTRLTCDNRNRINEGRARTTVLARGRVAVLHYSGEKGIKQGGEGRSRCEFCLSESGIELARAWQLLVKAFGVRRTKLRTHQGATIAPKPPNKLHLFLLAPLHSTAPLMDVERETTGNVFVSPTGNSPSPFPPAPFYEDGNP